MDETRHPQTPHPGHETTDVNIWAVGKFGIALVVVCVVSIALLWGLLKYFQSQEATSVATTIEPTKLFPQPQLQRDSDSGSPGHPRRGRQNPEQLRLGGSTKRRRAHPGSAGNRNPGHARTAGAHRASANQRGTQAMKSAPDGLAPAAPHASSQSEQLGSGGEVTLRLPLVLYCACRPSAAFAQPGQLLGPAAAIQHAGQQSEACPPRRARRASASISAWTSRSRSTSSSRTKPDATFRSPPSSSAASR